MNPYLASSMKTLSTTEEVLRNFVFETIRFQIMEPLKAHCRSLFNSRQLNCITRRPSLQAAKTVLILCAYNEGPRLNFFFQYYRSLGVEHFIFIDNQSTDQSLDIVRQHDDVTLYQANGSYKKSRFGVDWVNFILSVHCRNKWIIFADADEFLTFENDAAGLLQMTNLLGNHGRSSMQSIMLDMYGNDTASAPSVVHDGQNPLDTSPYYDADGYFACREIKSNTLWIKGGVRNRLFFNEVGQSPALNKTPLVRWKWYYAYLKSAHQLWPAHINGTGERPRSALLHFKFTASSTLYNSDIAARHTSEYTAYSNISSIDTFMGEYSKIYTGASDLINGGIISSDF